jgi:WD40 repeat protein
VWEVATGFCIKTLSGHSDWVRCLAVNASGSLLATGASDQAVVLWEMPAGSALLTMREHTHVVESVAFSPSGPAALDSQGVSSCTYPPRATTYRRAVPGLPMDRQ